MDVRNCRGCGRLFNYLQGPHLCPACMQKLEEKFSQVKDYLEDNPHATIPEIAKDNDVSTRQIEQWVREERLYFSDDSPYGFGGSFFWYAFWNVFAISLRHESQNLPVLIILPHRSQPIPYGESAKEIRCVTSTDNIEQERTEELPEVFGSSLLVLKNFSFIKRYDIMSVSNEQCHPTKI